MIKYYISSDPEKLRASITIRQLENLVNWRSEIHKLGSTSQQEIHNNSEVNTESDSSDVEIEEESNDDDDDVEMPLALPAPGDDIESSSQTNEGQTIPNENSNEMDKEKLRAVESIIQPQSIASTSQENVLTAPHLRKKTAPLP